MSIQSASEVMALLGSIEKNARKNALGLPQNEQRAEIWDGLAFSVAGVRVVSPMKEVSEMLPYPEDISLVPGSKNWMLGLANVRGTLLPVTDLQLFLGAKAITPSKTSRLLVVRLRGVVSGLLVPSVHGMRHFDLATRIRNVRIKGALGAYVFDAFRVDKQAWPVFSMNALMADPEFRSAAA